MSSSSSSSLFTKSYQSFLVFLLDLCSVLLVQPIPKKPSQDFHWFKPKLSDFFRIQRSTQPTEKDIRKKRRRTSSLVTSKKRRRLLAFSPTEDPARRLEQMASLATALTATGAQFSNDFTYICGMAPKSANNPAYEKEGMQTMMKRGECPPLMVVFDPVEGFTVEADKLIKDLTIITEYGDVDYLQTRENDDSDSIMTLISAANPSKSLVICPDKRSNIARFINGINNHTQSPSPGANSFTKIVLDHLVNCLVLGGGGGQQEGRQKAEYKCGAI
ncbi:hypothetical protein Tco_0865458 [Tanacetum coccineum]